MLWLGCKLGGGQAGVTAVTHLLLSAPIDRFYSCSLISLCLKVLWTFVCFVLRQELTLALASLKLAEIFSS